jgi:ribosomal protein S18 acetylase RimI-like enzyme
MPLAQPTIRIRPATLQDTAAVGALFDAYRQFYEQPADVALATRFIRERMEKGESVILVAEEPGNDEAARLVGFCQLYPSFCSVEARPIYTLYDLFVSPQARRTGAGRQLLLAAEAQARREGMARMDLTTARTNLAAQALYESLGWVRDEVFLAYSRAIPT